MRFADCVSLLFSEALLVIAPLGLQHKVIYWCNGSENVTFVPWNNVIEVVINEAITLVGTYLLLPILFP